VQFITRLLLEVKGWRENCAAKAKIAGSYKFERPKTNARAVLDRRGLAQLDFPAFENGKGGRVEVKIADDGGIERLPIVEMLR
jgi:hypothetical protein